MTPQSPLLCRQLRPVAVPSGLKCGLVLSTLITGLPYIVGRGISIARRRLLLSAYVVSTFVVT